MKIHRHAIHGLAGLSLFGMAATFAPAPAPLILGPTPIDTLPFVIDQPGSYCLVGNLSGNSGIRVEVDDVDIDLAGFTLEGPGLGAEEQGIVYDNLSTNVRVHDGTIKGWGGHAVYLYFDSVVEDVYVSECGSGIRASLNSLVERCTVIDAEETGLYVGAESIIRDCRVSTSAEFDDAVIALEGSTVLDTKAEGGFRAFFAKSGMHFERCSAKGFFSAGFQFDDRCVVLDCEVDQDGVQDPADGIRGGDHSRVEGCRVFGLASRGISLGSFGQVSDSSVAETGREAIRVLKNGRVSGCFIEHGNISAIAEGGGVWCTSNTIVENNTIANCKGPGIWVHGPSARVINNNVQYSSGPGLVLRGGSLVEGNTIQNNSEEGILVSQQDNVLRDNLVDDNDVGIRVIEHSNLVTGNRVYGNTTQDFDIPWGNADGPIRPADAHIMGSHPQANYGRD